MTQPLGRGGRAGALLGRGIVLGLAVALALAGCAAPPTPAPATATPTLTPVPPTATATLVPSATPIPSATPLPSPTAVPSAVPGGLYVDAAQTLGPVSPLIFGTNHGPWVAVPFAMLDAAFNAGVTVIRFPGGAWGDRNKVTPLQIDQFAAFLQQMGAVGTISVNLRDGTPEQAAEMVRYTNLERQYGVRYWSIGNEPTLYEAELSITSGETYDTERYNQEWRAFAEAMRAVDPSILLLGPELHQYSADFDANPKDSSGRDWMTEFLRANGDLVDVVTIHRYPYGTENATIADLRANSREWDDTIASLRALIHAETGRDLPIAVTEINSHWTKANGGEATPDSHYSALWLADVLGRMIRNDVFMMNQWMLSSQGGQGGWGLVGTSEMRPSYHVYQLYKQFGSERVYASSDQADVSIYAARRDDGALTLVVINLASAPVETVLRLDNIEAAGWAETWLFDAEHAAEQVEDTPVGAEAALRLPAEAMMLVVVEGS
jgi:hypothetical protein